MASTCAFRDSINIFLQIFVVFWARDGFKEESIIMYKGKNVDTNSGSCKKRTEANCSEETTVRVYQVQGRLQKWE